MGKINNGGGWLKVTNDDHDAYFKKAPTNNYVWDSALAYCRSDSIASGIGDMAVSLSYEDNEAISGVPMATTFGYFGHFTEKI